MIIDFKKICRLSEIESHASALRRRGVYLWGYEVSHSPSAWRIYYVGKTGDGKSTSTFFDRHHFGHLPPLRRLALKAESQQRTKVAFVSRGVWRQDGGLNLVYDASNPAINHGDSCLISEEANKNLDAFWLFIWPASPKDFKAIHAVENSLIIGVPEPLETWPITRKNSTRRFKLSESAQYQLSNGTNSKVHGDHRFEFQCKESIEGMP